MTIPNAVQAVHVRPKLRALADALWAAQQTRVAIPQPSTTTNPGLTVTDAYAVQGANLARRYAAGEKPVGHKVGLTSLAMQQQLGVDEPDFGVITDAMVTANGGTVDPATMLAPKLEAELAFRIGSALSVGPTLEQLRAAISDVAVAIELIDSRVEDWKIALVDTVADNASSAGIVVGPWAPATDELLDSLPNVVVRLLRDDEEVAAGPGSAVLGDPLVALHWLAGAIGAYGQSFKPGDIVLAGAVAASVPLDPGVTWSATAEGFDPVVVHSATAQ
ncbi:2-keto-4-pentenoate hydratase [Georgenia thermotolerans]|uniref:2-keto-4-pentenoate hydratase n=1 Tax=Georgenia thermotolerans TaxID=527326 RepID=A0A7J5UTJ5_9MICO|nr:fumarylacetoacetate hydrolase family protein [Georgenia thermotolerans]KAE8765598.1 2-keto-4-pentenoate hydratase [Georgenia thermotolerans]